MTPEEAIEKIRAHYPPAIISESYTKMVEALNLAIEALEKQIPEKPVAGIEGFYRGETVCPRCNKYFQDDLGSEHQYCCLCGKALDWGEYDGDH